MTLPNVVIGGSPNSGTSFLCHLIHGMGLSVGNEKNLKPADMHNRWGYWEHLPLREECRKIIPLDYRAHLAHTIPEEPLPRTDFVADQVASIADMDNIQVYKDNTLPLIYRLFSEDTKFIVLERMPEDCYKSPIRARGQPYQIPFLQFMVAYSYYFNLEVKLSAERDVLRLNYLYFQYFFDRCVETIAEFIDVELQGEDYDRLKKLWRPRT
ncbi:MAG: hypothetical protein ACXAB4_06310 [Candidatus Hodarchaeales archaeon]|jgi:hypothetical protein